MNRIDLEHLPDSRLWRRQSQQLSATLILVVGVAGAALIAGMVVGVLIVAVVLC
jgi:hypothetical protein